MRNATTLVALAAMLSGCTPFVIARTPSPPPSLKKAPPSAEQVFVGQEPKQQFQTD